MVETKEPPQSDEPDYPLPHRLRIALGSRFVEAFFTTLAAVGRLHPYSDPGRIGVEVHRNIAYGPEPAHPERRLDVYHSRIRRPPFPIALCFHGGGFRILSKDSHWMFGLIFAQRGYLAINVDYRLAPKTPFPGAFEDAAWAYEWVVKNAPSYGGDVSRIVVTGESAGANLATALTVAACYPRPEPSARLVYALERPPFAAVPACGLLQVSDMDRFWRDRDLPWIVKDRMVAIQNGYLPSEVQSKVRADVLSLDLADPLKVLERGREPTRPLPPFFIPVGTRDPVIDDSRRLARALSDLNVAHTLACYEGEPHAFHAMVFREQARRCWRDIFGFLDTLEDSRAGIQLLYRS